MNEDKIENKDIIVTGGAGFIGSNLALRLSKMSGNKITIVDNFHTGKDENINEIERVHIIRKSCGEFFKSLKIRANIIFHQGIYSSSPMYKENPYLTSKAIEEFIAIMEHARKYDVETVIYASTSSIYNGQKPPHREDMPPLVKDFYTEARYSIERLG